MNNDYLLRKLEESSGYYQHSFSNRYMNWKRFYSISKLFREELNKNKGQTEALRVLDAGCGDGWMIYRLKAEFGKKYNLCFTGIDISVLDIDFANKRKEYFSHDKCEFKVMDINNLSFSAEEFDIIISSEAIEHLQNVNSFMKELCRILKKDGLIILTTPQLGGSFFAGLVRFIKYVFSGLSRKQKKTEKVTLISQNEWSRARLSSSDGKTGAGLGHCSVKSARQWLKTFGESGFAVQSLRGTSGPWFGGPYLDAHRVIFACSVLWDILVEYLPFSYIWSETLLFELRKRSSLIHKHGLYL